jgi:hypothetical protein
VSRPEDTISQSDPVLVRILEQLTTYAAALDHADAPVLARLMRSTCDKLRSQYDKADALGRLNSTLSLALSSSARSPDDEWQECAACEELQTHPEVCMSGRENCGEETAYRCERCDHLVCVCYFQNPGNPEICVACYKSSLALSSPSKPAALNTDPPAETSQARPARTSTATPIQGRAKPREPGGYITMCDPCSCIDCDCRCHIDCVAADDTGMEHSESECHCHACPCPCHAYDMPEKWDPDLFTSHLLAPEQQ